MPLYLFGVSLISSFHRMLAQMRPPQFQSGQWIETYYQMIFEMGKCSDYKNLNLLEIREYYAPEALDIHYPNMNVGSVPRPPKPDELAASNPDKGDKG